MLFSNTAEFDTDVSTRGHHYIPFPAEIPTEILVSSLGYIRKLATIKIRLQVKVLRVISTQFFFSIPRWYPSHTISMVGIRSGNQIFGNSESVVIKVCGKTLKKHSLKAHMTLHTTNRPTYSCELCPRIFTTVLGFQRHVKHVHTECVRKQFKCTFDDCPAKFLTTGSLSSHIKLEHVKDPVRFACSFCDKKFKVKRHLTQHVETHAIQRTRLPCKFSGCDKTFKWGPLPDESRGTLKDPNTHLEDSERAVFPCKLCDRTFSTIRVSGIIREAITLLLRSILVNVASMQPVINPTVQDT
ncbi:Zinc finger and BTB domain-containing protein 14 [Folsomia candida]|uniref:Zinc finger and BTB domain-containing protein 14 n=1 Tax=Folsomia candida TaxID=158441 RepID=A0A226DL87_FOLCA|nr:Zinc finger and BTB domain-containing protein 14 [Folsomia candida]